MIVLQSGNKWLQFEKPVRVVTAVSPQDVLPALREVDTAVSQGLYAAGFIAYEAGAAFDLAVHPPQEGLPLVWFGLYQSPTINNQLTINHSQFTINHYQLGDWQPSVSREAYYAAIGKVKEQIAAGYTYQVNYTYHLQTDFTGDPLALFADLSRAQQAEYTAFVDTGRHVICSASPELFFQLDGDVLTSKPMKGTAVRGRTLAEDKTNMDWLHNSEKNRAENVMIVDMIRNDMGRVAEIGSVQVPHLFEVERYPTILQMTSTVTARTGASLADIIVHMFPCASITGAPKVQTMKIINELEPEARGVYTGAIGYISPERKAQFNVAIRTVVIDKEQGSADYGVGSGIVWDSDAADEYEECRVKSRVLEQKRPSFSLLESLLWEPEGGYFLLDAHVQRLMESADYFGIDVDETAVYERLAIEDLRLTIEPNPQKVRLLVAQDGKITVETAPLSQGALPEPVRVGLAAAPVNSGNIWLYHKTTRRTVYDQAKVSRPDCDDAVLWNERGEITESCRANVVVESAGKLWTPPVESGLLAGTMRGELLRDGRIHERTLTVEDLRRSSRIYLINSVRGWETAVFYD
ncbi:MAG: aminodeoxychorismate synthase component I [Chloroflexi bacterium]|nr:aminodeoxychorismate synthase component I [Chloroflexota bacterium]